MASLFPSAHALPFGLMVRVGSMEEDHEHQMKCRRCASHPRSTQNGRARIDFGVSLVGSAQFHGSRSCLCRAECKA